MVCAVSRWSCAPHRLRMTTTLMEPVEKSGGLLSRMPSLIRRPEKMPEPELIETAYEGDPGRPR